MRKHIYLFFAAALVLSVACKTAKPSAGSNVSGNETTAANDNKTTGSYILAVILKASRKADSSIAFEVSKVNKVAGKLKPGQNDNSGDDYTVTFADDKDVALATYHIKDPLNTWIESSDETGALKTIPVKRNEDFISVRTNYNTGMKKIIILKVHGSQQCITAKIMEFLWIAIV
ncbi:MAG: hypothetical protein ACTHKV_11600 [Flavipsychrobacter sp.]